MTLVGEAGHYLNRPAEFETSLLGLMRGYTPTVQRDRLTVRVLSSVGPPGSSQFRRPEDTRKNYAAEFSAPYDVADAHDDETRLSSKPSASS
ncbi:MAG TPA: hypothetical protein VHJ99_11795 [Candidatus Dormibacteraeota bacterium]|nr:hypothetical protein [Candidatus Dormibacteraeota bacterium]